MIDNVSGRAAVIGSSRVARSRATAGGFTVSGESRSDSASSSAEVAAPSLVGILAAQEEEQDAAQDRGARRHGQDILDELRGLQRDLLGSGVPRDRLRNLSNLADSAPAAVDRRLHDVLIAVSVRAQVELARYELAALQPHDIATPPQKE